MKDRNTYCIANFKMHKTKSETDDYISELSQYLSSHNSFNSIVICPPFTSMPSDNDTLNIGAQNISSNESGAHTGEISVIMIKELGLKYVILGHSERREYFKETNQEINKKIAVTLKNDLIPILCIGESLDQREGNLMEQTLKNQLTECLCNISFDNIIIAYEPVWAIGTGKTATPDMIIDTHKMIRNILNDIGFDGQKISILYGGSVNRSNAKTLIYLNDVDGFLIGGASLDVHHFYDIYKIIEECK